MRLCQAPGFGGLFGLGLLAGKLGLMLCLCQPLFFSQHLGRSALSLRRAARPLFFRFALRKALRLFQSGLRLLRLGQRLLARLLFCVQARICGGKINGFPVMRGCGGRLGLLRRLRCRSGCGRRSGPGLRRFGRGLRPGRAGRAALYRHGRTGVRSRHAGMVQRLQGLQVAIVFLLRVGKAHLFRLHQLAQRANLGYFGNAQPNGGGCKAARAHQHQNLNAGGKHAARQKQPHAYGQRAAKPAHRGNGGQYLSSEFLFCHAIAPKIDQGVAGTLFRAKNAVARIAQARHNITVLVQLFIQRS